MRAAVDERARRGVAFGHEEEAGRGEEVGDGVGGGQRGDAGVGDLHEVIGGGRAEVRGQRGAVGVGELVGVQARDHAEALRRRGARPRPGRG